MFPDSERPGVSLIGLSRGGSTGKGENPLVEFLRFVSFGGPGGHNWHPEALGWPHGILPLGGNPHL